MSKNKRKGFTLVEILVVLVLISCGLLPIYSLIRNGQQRISRADSRTLATLFGASALELCRAVGFDRAIKIANDNDFKELKDVADKNGYEIIPNIVPLNVEPLPPGAKPMYILQVQFVVKAKHQKAANPANDVPESKFVTLIIDPRHNYY
jgi:prepilin-type N-terminal cleavage/methylation domain-containing protein